jgi:hypothetical protein
VLYEENGYVAPDPLGRGYPGEENSTMREVELGAT